MSKKVHDFDVGVDWVYDPPKLYIKIDGKIYFFEDVREAEGIGLALISSTRYFLHNTLFDPPIRDRQILK